MVKKLKHAAYFFDPSIPILAQNPEANFVVAPSDHLILKEEAFLNKIQEGLNFVQEEDVWLTLGIAPTHPNTGYGYIHFDQNSKKQKSICKLAGLVGDM